MDAPPPPHHSPPAYYGRGPSLEYELANIRLPCDRLAAAMLLRDLADRLSQAAALNAVIGLAVPIIFVIVFLSVASMVGAPAFFYIVAILIMLAFLAMGAYGVGRAGSRRRDLLEAAEMVEAGLVPEDAYCNRSVLEVVAYVKARRGTMIMQGQ